MTNQELINTVLEYTKTYYDNQKSTLTKSITAGITDGMSKSDMQLQMITNSVEVSVQLSLQICAALMMDLNVIDPAQFVMPEK